MVTTARASVARVMVDTPLPQLDRLFDYAIPSALASQVRPGVRVRVPLRSAGRVADGFVVEVAPSAEFSGALSEIDEVVSAAPVLAPEVWALARRVADRSAGSVSDVIRLAVPKRQVRVEKAWLAAREEARQGSGAREPDQPGGHRPDPPHAGDADQRVGPGAEQSRDEADARLAPSDPPPPGALAAAVHRRARLAVDATPRVVELEGTGTWVGSWAVTLAEASVHALESGGSAILCVPDYRDQEQLMAALRAVHPAERVVQLDARQSGPDRYRAFLACLGEDPLVIVGNRSVVYAPARELALLAIWDDGDPLHAEPLAPYAHARDAALVRQELQGCGLWLMGHARSTEAQRLVELGFLGELAAARSYSPRVLPTAQQAPQDRFAAMARIPSSAWREARAALELGPVLVQVARPGYAPRLACTSCGESAKCLRCGGPLATRTASATPACSWCGALAADWRCTNCSGEAMRRVGQGATRTAEDLGRAFPGVRVVVADGERRLLTVDDTPALVIATRGAEPIAAGGYRAVLLLDGERMLARESLRVGEDCLRWWSNAAALAAPKAPVVLVGVGGALASAMVTWRPMGYAAAELADRRRLRFPPAVRVASVTGDPQAVERALASVRDTAGTDVLGPVEVDDASVRAIVRFDYARGHEVTAALRAELVRAASSRRRRLPGAVRRPALPTLRVHCDDASPFSE